MEKNRTGHGLLFLFYYINVEIASMIKEERPVLTLTTKEA